MKSAFLFTAPIFYQMPKESYYFSHDYNARNDKKIAALVREYKSSGYGIYWCTAEMLHEEGGQMELDDLALSAISKDLNEDFELVKRVIESCIKTFKLFSLLENNILTANRVRRNLDKRESISKKRSDAGKAGANAKQMLANAEQNEAKEKKGKEIKESKGEESTPAIVGSVSYDAEKEILGNQKEFERICMATNTLDVSFAKTSLRKFHLYLESKNRYPQTRKQLFSGFEKWLMDDPKSGNNNGTPKKQMVI